jgi:hypothetical protein
VRELRAHIEDALAKLVPTDLADPPDDEPSALHDLADAFDDERATSLPA